MQKVEISLFWEAGIKLVQKEKSDYSEWQCQEAITERSSVFLRGVRRRGGAPVTTTLHYSIPWFSQWHCQPPMPTLGDRSPLGSISGPRAMASLSPLDNGTQPLGLVSSDLWNDKLQCLLLHQSHVWALLTYPVGHWCLLPDHRQHGGLLGCEYEITPTSPLYFSLAYSLRLQARVPKWIRPYPEARSFQNWAGSKGRARINRSHRVQVVRG